MGSGYLTNPQKQVWSFEEEGGVTFKVSSFDDWGVWNQFWNCFQHTTHTEQLETKIRQCENKDISVKTVSLCNYGLHWFLQFNDIKSVAALYLALYLYLKPYLHLMFSDVKLQMFGCSVHSYLKSHICGRGRKVVIWSSNASNSHHLPPPALSLQNRPCNPLPSQEVHLRSLDPLLCSYRRLLRKGYRSGAAVLPLERFVMQFYLSLTLTFKSAVFLAFLPISIFLFVVLQSFMMCNLLSLWRL